MTTAGVVVCRAGAPRSFRVSKDLRRQAHSLQEITRRCRDLEAIVENQMREIRSYRLKVAELREELKQKRGQR